MATVLVVDDEQLVLRLAESILSSAGYRVVPVRGAAAALRIAARGSESIDIVLADVVMPGTSGPTCVDQLVALDGSLAVILMSEFGIPAMRKYADGRGFHFVSKPLDPGDLARVLELALSMRTVLEEIPA